VGQVAGQVESKSARDKLRDKLKYRTNVRRFKQLCEQKTEGKTMGKLSKEELHAVRVAAGHKMREVQLAKIRRLEQDAKRHEREYEEWCRQEANGGQQR
jgi:hypothetical protein